MTQDVSGQDPSDGNSSSGNSSDGDVSSGGSDLGVTVYTRPGCPFCTSLRAGLRRRNLPFSEVDIWQDPSAAATVRSLADGNETVPTVVIGDRSVDAAGQDGAAWSAVNPSAEEVVAAVATHAPGQLPQHKPGFVQGTLNALGLRQGSP